MAMTTSRSVFLALVLGFGSAAIACTGIGGGQADTAAPTPAATTPPAPDAKAPAPTDDAALVACTVDADCEVVEMGCCDACNGGFYMSIAKTHHAAAIARWHETDCSGACTERACEWHEAPVCDAGVCARMEDRVDANGNATRVLVKNR